MIRTHAQGFTLIEILVVVFILGVVASMAVLAIGDPRSREMAHFAEKLKMTFELAEQEAILRPAEFGVSVTQDQYQFFSFDELGNHWQPLTHHALLKQQSIPSYLTLQLTLEGQNVALNNRTSPLIALHSSSHITPFQLTIGLDQKPPSFSLTGEKNGKLILKKISSQQEVKR